MTSKEQFLIDLFEFTYLKSLRKDTYLKDIEAIKKKFQSELTNVGMYLDTIGDLSSYAESLPSEIHLRRDQLKSARKQDLYLIDCNLNMIGYVLPILGTIPSEKTEEFVQCLVAYWNTSFPSNKINVSTIEDIQGGFRTRLCYISTAVCESLGKDDACYELQLLRDFRDQILRQTEEGKHLIEQYYDIAPTIVKRIQKRDDAKQIFTRIWDRYLSQCIKYIEVNQHELSVELYTEMVHELKEYH